jgi:heat shock protein HtpX
MWFNRLKTAVLLAFLSGLLLLIGVYLGGITGLTVAFGLSLVFNGIAYFYSDQIVLRLYKAEKLDTDEHQNIYNIVKELSEKEQMPMPSLYIIKNPMANAFATGRNPQHASVAVTTGILQLLSDRELRGVLAHELSHVKNRDILVSSIAAVLATTIGYLANIAYYSAIFGGRGGNKRDGFLGILGLLLIVILMPVAASLIQLAISRSREYLADESGSELSQDPQALASALEKLHTQSTRQHLDPQNTEYTTTAHMFIVNPFTLKGVSSLFSTHPPVSERIKRLYKMEHDIKNK